jgi:hypothetical protein
MYYFEALKVSPLLARVFVKVIFGAIFGKTPLEYYLFKRQQRSSTNTTVSGS